MRRDTDFPWLMKLILTISKLSELPDPVDQVCQLDIGSGYFILIVGKYRYTYTIIGGRK
jgi:hypothetical protein